MRNGNIRPSWARAIPLALCFLSLAGRSSTTRAQPWPRTAGELFTTTSIWVYTTTKQTGEDGTVSTIANGGRFTGVGTGIYFEYGLSPRWTLQGLLSGKYQRFVDQNGSSENLSPGDQRVGVRYALLNGTWAASIGGTWGFPWLYSTDQRPLPGFGQHSVQINGTVGRGFQIFDMSGWSLLKVGTRHHLGAASTQLKNQILFGFHFNRRWGGILQQDGTFALNDGTFRLDEDIANPNVRSGFSVIKITASVLYEYSPRATIQLGAFREVWGRKSGFGGGGILSIWYRY